MTGVSSNFNFLATHDAQLARLGALAERYFHDDFPAALIKLRQLAEFLAKEVAARHALLPSSQVSFDDTLRSLKVHGVLPREVGEFFYYLKRLGNAAAHDNAGTPGEVLSALKVARSAAVWFHQTYGNAPNFKPGPFIPPAPPVDATAALKAEIAELRAKIRTSADAEAKAQLARQEAEAARLAALQQAEERGQEKVFWEQYAAETEQGLRAAEAALKEAQKAAEAAPAQQLNLLAFMAAEQAEKIELDEATTRVLIDDQLRAAGWEVDSAVLRYGNGARPASKPIAIAEWPTETGPVDYALFIEGRCVGVIEAKREVKDVPGRLGQAKRYATGITLTPEEAPQGGPWINGLDTFRVPFLFVTNGRPYIKQLATKSGIWFMDARPNTGEPRALPEWFSPRDLKERLEQTTGGIKELAEHELGVSGLRPYQQEAIAAVQKAVRAGQRHILLAMATGTGKTRLAIALMYELLAAKRFRRILFLVDRNALGRQTLDAMSTTDTNGFLKFDEVFPVANLVKKFPEATDRVQVATVQAMIKRVFDDPEAEGRPTPGTYDLIIVDEAHRGYTLDADLREEDLDFRSLDDYLSAYRRVLDYFDATKVALTATPALHTREIFGHPVFHYSYRQAVIDGYLIDHRPPRRIITALSQTGIHFDKGEEVNVIDPRTGQIDLFDLPDEVDFEVSDFNKKVYTEAFNKAVAQAVAQECPPDRPGKTLLFAARDDHADILVAALREALTNEYGPQPHDLVEKITGSVDRPVDRIKAFKNDPRPKYVVTVDLLTTGIDVPAITNLVFVRRVNSRILYDQMIGRATRLCDEIGKDYFCIFDAVDLYANLQAMSDMTPVVVKPALPFTTLVTDLANAPSEDDKAHVRDQIVVKLRQRLRHIGPKAREALETVLGPLDKLADRLKTAPPADTLSLFQQHPSLAVALDKAGPERPAGGVLISEHEDELVEVRDDFGGKGSPEDYIEAFQAFIKANMNAVPALIAATQRPRDLTRAELKQIALLLDEKGFSEAALRQAYGRARNADIAAHIIGFVRQAALGDPLVPYQTRVDNGVQRLLASRDWTPQQKQWLTRIGRALRETPVSDPSLLAEPLFAQQGGFPRIDETFDHRLADVLMDLNAAIWDSASVA